jgi:hypothetical protein
MSANLTDFRTREQALGYPDPNASARNLDNIAPTIYRDPSLGGPSGARLVAVGEVVLTRLHVYNPGADDVFIQFYNENIISNVSAINTPFSTYFCPAGGYADLEFDDDAPRFTRGIVAHVSLDFAGASPALTSCPATIHFKIL